MELGAAEGRVLGCLVEKQLTTPQQYPLTLNALLAACNQASNRDPVVAYTEAGVESALGTLKDRGLVRFVLPSHGRSAVRYRQVLDEELGLDRVGVALVAVLLLRGPQTVGELRARTERLVGAGEPGAVDRALAALAGPDRGLVARLARRPGHKGDRYAERLTVRAEEPGTGPDALTGPGPAGTPNAGTEHPEASRPSLEALRDEIDELRSAVGELRAALDELRSGLGG